MSKHKQNKCFKNMTMAEAIEWAEKNTAFADVRNRLASRMVAYLFLNALRSGAKYVEELENRNAELTALLNVMNDKLKLRG
ncbi:MAG: hypothetical protein WC679_12730 [Bacteroidales bacterium]|jgi:hypothetical protein